MTNVNLSRLHYGFWDLATDFEDSFRKLIELGHDPNRLKFTLQEAEPDPDQIEPNVAPTPRFTLAWQAKDGDPLPPDFEQALLDYLPVKPATPNTPDPEAEWQNLYEYIVMRTQAHLQGVC